MHFFVTCAYTLYISNGCILFLSTFSEYFVLTPTQMIQGKTQPNASIIGCLHAVHRTYRLACWAQHVAGILNAKDFLVAVQTESSEVEVASYTIICLVSPPEAGVGARGNLNLRTCRPLAMMPIVVVLVLQFLIVATMIRP